MKIRYLATILMTLLFDLMINNFAIAQAVQNPLRVIPKSSEGTSSDQYLNMQVNTAVGVPNISIPIYTLVDKNIKIPISISYNASGVRIDNISTPVGLNWVLNAGGIISRDIMGLADEGPSSGWFATSSSDENSYDDNILENFYKGFKDPAPDVFTYNFMGKSGSFFYDKNKILHKTTNDEIKIETPLEGKPMRAWDELGNCYYFEAIETTQIDVYREYLEPMGDLSGSGNTGWRLTKIITPTNETINFEYDTYLCVTNSIVTSNDYISSYGMTSHQSLINYFSCQLKRISTSSQEVIFSYENNNTLSMMKRRLKSIAVRDLILNDTLMKASLNHIINSRLWLTGVDFWGRDNQIKQRYAFNYNGTSLPDYGSYARDIFGYFNNNQVSHMIPVDQGNLLYFDQTPADREVNSSTISNGVLTEITFPAGGKTRFTYEPNFENTAQGSLYAPGLRVKTVEHINENNQTVKKEVYEYSNLQGQRLHQVGSFLEYYEDKMSSPYHYIAFSSSPLQSVLTDYMYRSGFYYGKVNIKSYDGSNLGSYITENYIGLLDNFNMVPYISSQEYYKGNGEMVKRNYFNYTDNIVATISGHTLVDTYITDPNNPVVHYVPLATVLYKSSTILKSMESTTNYFNNQADSVYSETHYEYNDHFLPSKITTYFSPNSMSNNRRIQTIKYSSDYIAGDSWIAQMKEKYIIGNPVDIRTYKGFGVDDKLIEGKTTVYNNYGQATKAYTWEGASPSSITWDSNSVLSTGFQLKNENIYDGGNLVQSTSQSNQISSIIWGYNGNTPVIKAENASYSTLSVAVASALSTVGYSNLDALLLNMGDISSNTSKQTIWMNFNSALRNNILLKNSLITTNTHAPFVGVTSQTDPTGLTTYYQYDSFQRLLLIKDQNGNIIKSFDYHNHQ